jgi:hypothetical protein
MKRFLYSTLLFTLVSYAVQWIMDVVAPLQETPASSLNLSSITSLDDVLNNPAALDALQNASQSLLDPASFERMIQVTLIACLIMAIGPIYRFIANSIVLPLRGLRWNANRVFLNVTDATEPDVNPLLLQKGAFRVKNFIYTGRNTGGKPIGHVSGYIRSDKTKEIYPLLLDHQSTDQHNTIPPHSDFMITADLPFLTTKKFLKQFDTFKLVFYYNGHRYTKRFSLESIVLLLKRRARELKH